VDDENIPDFLRRAADAEMARLERLLPLLSEQRFMLFLEIQRVFDVACVQHTLGGVAVRHDMDILRWGMNLATSKLLDAQKVPYGLPITATSDVLRDAARNILWNFGAIALTRRAADMVQHGFMLAERNGESFTFRDAGTGPIQYMDHVEADLLNRAESVWTKEKISAQGWILCDPEELESKLQAVGSYYARPQTRPGPLLSPAELEALMVPLIHPWKTPQVTMMGYGATEEVDSHFFVEVLPVIDDFRSDAGIHPSTNFGKFTGSDVLEVTALLLSFFRKHVTFGLLAKKHFPEISVRESFTIWGPKEELIDAVCSGTRVPRARVRAVIKTLTLTADDLRHLENETTPLLPMLIDLGNGYFLKPVSCLMKNPLAGFQKISQWRNPSTRNVVSASREAWFRQELYSLFGGSRYLCVPGNVVLRDGAKRLTDIDAAIFDRTTGELALFQLKWQDYATNSIKELRSKARNLASEIDMWGERVNEWIFRTAPKDVAQALRLKLRGPERISAIFLFGLSRSVARTHGYGFPVTNPYLSVASWPQFRRIRGQVGPAPHVFSTLHEVLRLEETLTLSEAEPQPFTLTLPGIRMHFADLWSTWDDASV